VAKERLNQLNQKEGFHFCTSAKCEVVYYQPSLGVVIKSQDVTVPVGQKETDSSRQLCYCFNYTAAAIETEVRATGNSSIPDVIAEKCRNGLDQCAEKNPQGTCCLGNVHAVLNLAKSSCNSENSSNQKESNLGFFSLVGALFSVILASACCWLPPLLIGLGLSGGVLSITIATWSPILLPVTIVLLGMAFYFSKKKSLVVSVGGDCCSTENFEEGGGDCCSPPEKKISPEKVIYKLLWVLVIVGLCYTFFKDYIAPSENKTETVVVKLEGINGQDDLSKIESSLLQLEEIAFVTFDTKKNMMAVGVKEDMTLLNSKLLSSIESAGKYKGSFADQIKWNVKISGMTCGGCSDMIQSKVTGLSGVYNASVSHEKGEANISTNKSIGKTDLDKAVTSAGFKVLSISKVADE